PNPEHVIRLSLSEALHAREPLHPGLVITFDYFDAGLLEHDLAHPNRIGVRRLPPGQVPLPSVEPIEQPLSHLEPSHGSSGGTPRCGSPRPTPRRSGGRPSLRLRRLR